MNYCEENTETCKFIQLNGCKLCCFENGHIYRVLENGDMKYAKGTNKNGYLRTKLKCKEFSHQRIIAYAFLGLDIENSMLFIDHKNFITTDNRVTNLRIVTPQENRFHNQSKGYNWDKRAKKWKATIQVDMKGKHLGYFEKEEDARAAYLDAKKKYHIITNN